MGGSNVSDGGTAVCEKQSSGMTSDGHAVIMCDQGFAEAPFVRPPPDEGAVVYGGLDMGAKQLVTRGGRIDLGAALASLVGTEQGPSGPSGDRYAYAIYRATLGTSQEVQSVAPAIIIDDAVFMQSYLIDIDLEGTISKRTGTDMLGSTFELTPSLPIRLKTSHDLNRVDAGIHGFPTVELAVTVTNLSAGVLSADGKTCLPALSSAGDQNPFFGVTDGSTPKLSRVPNMHGGNDDVLVIWWPMGGSDMANGFYIAPSMLMAQSTLKPYVAAPHGNPIYAPFITVDVVKSGGAACP